MEPATLAALPDRSSRAFAVPGIAKDDRRVYGKGREPFGHTRHTSISGVLAHAIGRGTRTLSPVRTLRNGKGAQSPGPRKTGQEPPRS